MVQRGVLSGGAIWVSNVAREETMARLLVVDDEPNILYSFEKAFRSDTLDVIVAPTGGQAIELTTEMRPDVAILDVRLTDMSGLELFDRIREIDPRIPVIIVTAFSATATAIEAMKRGAYEYLVKPVDVAQLRELLERALALSRLRHVPAVFSEVETSEDADRMVGHHPAMQEVYKAIGRVAPTDVTVLITGESGTGKELAARALWQHSGRSDKTFLAINCAAIPEAILESELFGHEKGAFTGADRRRIGRFEQANGGTVFLDEVGDMSSGTQAKLLRFLQEQFFERVGGDETIRTDVRVLAATNKDLENEVAARRFRNDLLFRLNVFSIQMPPLRRRREDIDLLTDHFVRLLSHTLGRTVNRIAPEVRDRLADYDWPGNVRQLQSALKYALIHASGDVLTLDCLPEKVLLPGSGGHIAGTRARLPDVAAHAAELLSAGETDLYRQLCVDVDRTILDVVLEHAKGNQVQASELLGISRTTLRAKLRALGIAAEDYGRAGRDSHGSTSSPNSSV
jgi:two-component system nitrogen regulation response regulator GlnG